MRIQPEWEKKLQQHIITEEMLEAALLSTVLRQANWHEKRLEYSRWRRTVHDYAAKAAACEMEMTVRIRWLLSSQAPLCIHKTFGGCCYRRIRGSDPDFAVLWGQAACQGLLVRCSRKGRDNRDDFPSSVPYADIADSTHPKYNYYLYYVIGSHGFELPLRECDFRTYEHLPVVFTGNRKLYGEKPQDLVSVSFVKKVLEVMRMDDWVYQKKEIQNDSGFLMPSGIREKDYMHACRQKYIDRFGEVCLHEIIAAMRKEAEQAEGNVFTEKERPAAYEGKEKDEIFRQKLLSLLSPSRTIHDLVQLLPDG